MAKVTLSDISTPNSYTIVSTYNANNTLIETAMEKTLSRDGTSPNEMNTNLDMNSNRILNLPAPASPTEPIRLEDIDEYIAELNQLEEQIRGLVSGSLSASYATQDDAEDGLNNTYLMTPLRTKQELRKFYTVDLGDFPITKYGAVEGLDASTAIQDAIDEAYSLGGGMVVIPPGTWDTTGNLDLKYNVDIRSNGGILRIMHPTNNLFTIRGRNVIDNLQITNGVERTGSAVAGTAGHAFYIPTSVSEVWMEDNYIEGFESSIYFAGGNTLLWLYANIIYKRASTTSIGIEIGGATAGNDQYLEFNFIRSQSLTPGEQGHAGIVLRNTGATMMRHNGCLWCGIALLIEPGNGQRVEWVFSLSDIFDSGDTHGVLINPSGTGFVKGVEFTSLWSASSNGVGVYVTGTGSIDGILMRGGRIINNGSHGILVDNGIEIHLSNVVVAGNSRTEGDGVAHGITINTTVSFSIIDCRSGNILAFPIRQGYGIAILADCNNYRLLGNDCIGNVTGGILNASSGATTKVIANNIP